MLSRRQPLAVKTHEQIRLMRSAGLVVAAALAAVEDAAVPGATTAELDTIAREVIRDHGARPSFPEVPGYRHTLCVSVNEEVVHGIPGKRILREGDLVSVDCGAILDGWHGDAAISIHVGGREAADPVDRVLSDVTQDALWAGIAAFRIGATLNDVGAAVEDAVARQARRRGIRFSIVEGYTGHGIGRAMHEEPDVYNYRVKGRTARVRAGATVAIEPMITAGAAQTEVLADEWTVVTIDGSHAAHWEHTVAVTDAGAWVLTALDGGAAELLRRQAPCGPLDASHG